MPIDRVAALKGLLEQNPEDSFVRYGLAMEYSKASQLDEAAAEFEALISRNPDYCAAYYHGGKTFERMGRLADARRLFEAGVAAAGRTGDEHARSELLGALEMLG